LLGKLIAACRSGRPRLARGASRTAGAMARHRHRRRDRRLWLPGQPLLSGQRPCLPGHRVIAAGEGVNPRQRGGRLVKRSGFLLAFLPTSAVTKAVSAIPFTLPTTRSSMVKVLLQVEQKPYYQTATMPLSSSPC
jgi:hypothetical protein